MITEQELTDNNFTKQRSPFTGRDEYVTGKIKDTSGFAVTDKDGMRNVIIYDISKQLAICGLGGEFGNINRICETIDELLEFCYCIKFLFKLPDEVI